MPNKAKLVTRSTATTSVTTDNLNKGSALEFAELDSSLINLRDQTFGIVADDSSTIDVGAGDTLYIQGGTNVTTSTNSDGSITINSTASGGASVGNFTFSADSMRNDGSFTIESTASAAEISIISGTDGSDVNSRILLDTRRMFTGQNNTNINIQAPGGSGDFTIANGGTTGSPDGFHNSIILTDTNDGQIEITPKTGKWVEIDGLRFPTADGSANQVLITDGSGILSFSNAGTGDVTGSSTTTFTNKTFDADGTGNSLTNIDVANLKSGVLDTDISSVAGTDTTLASAKAIKTYVDANSGSGAALTGSTNNTITTVTGANAIQGEANLTFDGTTLATTGSITATNNISSEGIQLVDNVISASRSNDSLFIEPAGTGIVSLGNGKIDAYSTNARWKNGVLRVFEDLAFDADSQTSSGGRKYLHTTLTNVKFNGDNSSNSNIRWRNSYNILQLDMNSSELTPSGTDRIVGLTGEVDILNSDTSTAGRLSHSAGVWGVGYAYGPGDLTVNNMAGVIAKNFVESASGKTITVDQATGFQYNGTAKDGSGTDTITAEIGFHCNGGMTGTTQFAFKDDTNGQSLFGDVLINQNTISTNSSNANLEINANGSGTVVLENLSVAGDGATVTGILDEDDMSSNSNVKLATQQSIKAYVDANAGSGASIGDITFNGSTISSPSNGDLTLDPSGTGDIILSVDGSTPSHVRVGSGSAYGSITSNGNQQLEISANGGGAAQARITLQNEGNGRHVDLDPGTDGTIRLFGTMTGATGSTAMNLDGVAILDNTISTNASNANLEINANGSGTLELQANTNVTGSATVSTTLGVTGASTLDGVTITDNHISSNRSNDNIVIEANGTGQVELGVPFDNIRTNTRYDYGVNKAYVNGSYDGATRIIANNEGIKGTLTQTTSSTNFQFMAENRTAFEMAGFSQTSANDNRGLRAKHYNVVVGNEGSSTAATIGVVNPITSNATLFTNNGNIVATSAKNYRATLEGEPTSGKTATFTNGYNYWGKGPIDLGEGGTTAGTNYYGLYIDTGSVATNNYGVWINNDAYINKLGGVTLQSGTVSTDGISIVDNEITATRSNDDLEISANGTGKVSISSDGTFSSGATDLMLDNFGDVRSRCKGVHLYRQETISSALTSSGDRRQGHLIGQEYTLGNYSSSDKDNRYRGQTVACAVDLNGATVNSTNVFGGAMGAQGQAAVQNRDASNAGTIGNTIGVMGGSYFYSPQTINVTHAHGVLSYVEQDDGGGTVTMGNAYAFKSQINKYAGTMTNGYAYFIDTNDATNKYGFYDTTNSESRMGAVRLDNQASDPTNGADFCHIYAKDVSSSSKVFVREEDGTATRISPHNDKGEWEFYSYNKKTGKKVIINMERMIRKLEKYTGEKFIETN